MKKSKDGYGYDMAFDALKVGAREFVSNETNETANALAFAAIVFGVSANARAVEELKPTLGTNENENNEND